MTQLTFRGALLAAAMLSSVPCAYAQTVQPFGAPSTQASAGSGDSGHTIPLPLPPERSGIPLPLSIQYVGGARSGTAGIGWTVPLSVVRESSTLAGRLPRPSGTVPTKPLLSLGGSAIALVPSLSDGSRYVARDKAMGLELAKEDGDLWVMRQGEYEYVFGQLPNANPDTYYLIQIGHLPSEGRVDIDYRILVDQEQGLLEVLLDQATYNFMPGAGADCFATRVVFTHASPGSLGLSADSGPLARPDGVLDIQAPTQASYLPLVARQILDSVSVRSRSHSCSAPLTTVAQVDLDYDVDPDLGLPRLRGADRVGLGGSATLPLVRYDYGSRGRTPGKIDYDPDETRVAAAALPADMANDSFSDVETIALNVSSSPIPGDGLRNDSAIQAAYRPWGTSQSPRMTIEKTWSTFADLTGDGLPDLVYRNATGSLRLARNTTTGAGLSFAPSVALFAQGNFPVSEVNSGAARLPLGLRATADIHSDGISAGLLATTSWEYVRLMDFNGDGRLDVVDARGGKDWIVYINAPSTYKKDPSYPEFQPSTGHPIYWMKTLVDVSKQVIARNNDVDLDDDPATTDNGWVGANRFPISWSISGGSQAVAHAYRFKAESGLCTPEPGHIADNPDWEYDCAHDQGAWQRLSEMDQGWMLRPSSTHVMHDIRDINGDSFPDLVATYLPTGFNVVESVLGVGLNSPPMPPECNDQGVCAPSQIFARATPPWSTQRNWTSPDRTLTQLSGSFSAFLDCVEIEAGVCDFGGAANPHEPYVDPAASACYRWYGPADDCAVQYLSVQFQGRRMGLASIPDMATSVHFNVVGARLGPQSLNIGRAFRTTMHQQADSANCPGVDHWKAFGTESDSDMRLNEYSVARVCGTFDANADGLADRGPTEAMRLGVGKDYLDRTVESAGNGAVNYKLPVCEIPGRRHPNYLDHPGLTPPPADPGIVSSAAGLDLNGDGFGDRLRALGTGSGGFGVASPAGSTDAERAISSFDESDPDCYDSPRAREMMIDVNGDGRPDKARLVDGQLRIRQPVVLDAAGEVVDAGLLQAGRIIRATDGYGTGTEYHYANAKLQDWGAHRVPFAEIVLEKVTPVAAAGSSEVKRQEPVWFAYGFNEMRYDTYAERFLPTGYSNTATIRGIPLTTGPNAGKFKGKGQVTIRRNMSMPLDKRDFLAGTVDQQRSYEGYFLSAADLLRQYMTASYEEGTGYTGNVDNWIDVEMFTPLSGDVPSEYSTAYCNRLDFPYGGLAAPSSQASTRYCVSRPLVSLRNVVEWEGIAFPAATYNYADIKDHDGAYKRHVRRFREVLEWDSRGRPTSVKDHGDSYYSGDEVCTTTTYASGHASDFWEGKEYAPLTLKNRVSISDCDGNTLRSLNYKYIGASTGRFGMLPRLQYINTTYPVASGVAGQLSESFRYNDYGQVVGSSSTNNSPLEGVPNVTRDTTLAFDPFSLVVTERRTTATDVPDYSIVVGYSYEPGTYKLLTSTDQQTGVTTHYAYDDFGRPTTTAVSSADYSSGTPQILSATEYLGEQGDLHTGRKVRSRVFQTWMPLSAYSPGSSARDGEMRLDSRFDVFGRVIRQERYLGEDYDDKRLSSAVGFDSLGRVLYQTSPYELGAPNGEPVTTHLHRNLSSEPYCQVQAPELRTNPQRRMKEIDRDYVSAFKGARFNLPITDEDLEQVSTCQIASYGGGQRFLFSLEPGSLGLPGERALASAVELFDGMGRLLQQRIWDVEGAEPAQQVGWAYDRYGRVKTLVRSRNPDLHSPTDQVRWYYEYDGLDRLTTFRHNTESSLPKSLSPVIYEYDSWNQLVRVDNGPTYDVDGFEISGDIGRLYDGFGRLTRIRALDFPEDDDYGPSPPPPLITDPANRDDGQEIRYYYRVAGEPGAGQLARITRQGPGTLQVSREIEYDAFGRPYLARHANGALTAEVEQRYEGFVRMQQRVTRSTDNGMADELVQFGYDSAGRTRTSFYGLRPATVQLFNVQEMDLFGRPLEVLEGNGSQTSYEYADSGQRRLLSVTQTLPGTLLEHGPVRRTVFEDHDPLGRVLSMRSERLKPVAGGHQVVEGFRHKFAYSHLDTLTRFEQYKLPTGTKTHGQSYRYDPLGNLTYVLDDELSDKRYVPLAFDRDRLCAVELGEYSSTPLPTARDTSCSVFYDRRGNVTEYRDPQSGQDRRISYEAMNEVQSVTYGYSGWVSLLRGTAGEVVRHQIENTPLLTVGPVEQRFSQNGSGSFGLIWENPLGGGISRRGTAVGSSLYYKGFSTNTADTSLDSLGAEKAMRAYDPYGRTIRVSEPDRTAASKYRWHGVDICAGSNGSTSCNMDGLYMMGPRLYDAGMGRFLQRDPLVIPRSAAKVHPYQYAWNNPIRYSDRSGMDPGIPTVSQNYYDQGGNYYGELDVGLGFLAIGMRIYDIFDSQSKDWRPNISQDGIGTYEISLIGTENAIVDMGGDFGLPKGIGLDMGMGNVGYAANLKGGELGVSMGEGSLSFGDLDQEPFVGPLGNTVYGGEMKWYGTMLGVELTPGVKPNFSPLSFGFEMTQKNGPLEVMIGAGLGLDPFRFDISCSETAASGKSCWQAGIELAESNFTYVMQPDRSMDFAAAMVEEQTNIRARREFEAASTTEVIRLPGYPESRAGVDSFLYGLGEPEFVTDEHNNLILVRPGAQSTPNGVEW